MTARRFQPPLPVKAADRLLQLRAAGRHAEANGWVRTLLGVGWPVTTIATATGVTRAAIHIAAQRLPVCLDGHPAPPMPPRPPARPLTMQQAAAAAAAARRRDREALFPAADQQRLRDLHALGRRVVRHTPPDHPNRAASEQLTTLIIELVDRGVSVGQIPSHGRVRHGRVDPDRRPGPGPGVPGRAPHAR